MLTPVIEKGVAFYLLKKRDIDDSIRIYEVNRSLYERIIGPIPLQELSEPLPKALLQIPPTCWGSRDVMKLERKRNRPRLGDLVVCVDAWSTITLGFFTTKGFADNMLLHYPFVEWETSACETADICGFLYLPGSLVHYSITDEIEELIKNGRT